MAVAFVARYRHDGVKALGRMGMAMMLFKNDDRAEGSRKEAVMI